MNIPDMIDIYEKGWKARQKEIDALDTKYREELAKRLINEVKHEEEIDALKTENERLRKAAENLLKLYEGEWWHEMSGTVIADLRDALGDK